MDRRRFLQGLSAAAALPLVRSTLRAAAPAAAAARPNILVFVADDWSWAHTGFAGCRFARTPNFDRVAREGAYFETAFAASPICTPTRGSLLTGLQPWQLDEGIHLLSTLPAEFETYPNALARAGYHTGFTGKGWGPGNWQASGRTEDPAGTPWFGQRLAEVASKGMRADDLPGNFHKFLEARPPETPFCFWFGCHEPHVPYEQGRGLRAGLKPESVEVPPFLPDTPQVRADLLDYAFEIERLDEQLGACLDALEKSGQLDDTLVIVVGDNGMPFPSAKHTCYEYGVRVPLAMRWGKRIPAGRRVADLVSTPDLTATIYAAAGIDPARPCSAANLLPGLAATAGNILPQRDSVVVAHERGNLCREGDVGYPMRAIRTERHLFIRNYAPERWPTGDPPKFGDVDPLPTKDLLIAGEHDPALTPYFRQAMGKRPAEELFDIQADPACRHNLALAPEHAELCRNLRERMESRLKAEGDYRLNDQGDRYDRMPPRAGRKAAPAPAR